MNSKKLIKKLIISSINVMVVSWFMFSDQIGIDHRQFPSASS